MGHGEFVILLLTLFAHTITHLCYIRVILPFADGGIKPSISRPPPRPASPVVQKKKVHNPYKYACLQIASVGRYTVHANCRARAYARAGGAERGVPLLGRMGFFLTKRLEGKGKNDMHGKCGIHG
jgi:hypothetical protein